MLIDAVSTTAPVGRHFPNLAILRLLLKPNATHEQYQEQYSFQHATISF
jgi:hypothetical protein